MPACGPIGDINAGIALRAGLTPLQQRLRSVREPAAPLSVAARRRGALRASVRRCGRHARSRVGVGERRSCWWRRGRRVWLRRAGSQLLREARLGARVAERLPAYLYKGGRHSSAALCTAKATFVVTLAERFDHRTAACASKRERNETKINMADLRT